MTSVCPDEIPIYRYAPLGSVKDDIRVFHLAPGSWDAPITGGIEVVKHDHVESGLVAYEAISYVWGDPSDITRIICEGGYVCVPTNLHAALQHLRAEDAPRTIWADSICMNQQDPHEKAHQVQRMYDIFHNAERVIMWLGVMTADTQYGLAGLAELCEATAPGSSGGGSRAILDDIDYANTLGSIIEIDPRLIKVKHPNWSAMARVVSLSYFSRLWVLQEAIAARKGTLKLGKDELDWDIPRQRAFDLATTYYGLRHVLTAVTPFPKIKRHLLNFILMANGFDDRAIVRRESGQSTNMLWILLATSSFECRDARDELFAVIHLASGINPYSEEDAALKPDYTASPSEVFQRLAIWLLVRRQQFDYIIFARAYLGEVPPNYFDLADAKHEENEKLLAESTAPSWVPLRLSTSMNTGYFFHGLASGHQTMKLRPTLCGGDPSMVYQQPSISEDGRVLGMLGRIVAEVASVSSVTSMDYVAEEVPTPTNSVASTAMLDDNVAELLKKSLIETWGEAWMTMFKSRELCDLIAWLVAVKATISPLVAQLDAPSSGVVYEYGERYLDYLEAFMASKLYPVRPDVTPETTWEERFAAISKRILNATSRSHISRTTNNGFGFVPHHTRPGDKICVLNAVSAPMLIRPLEDGKYLVVGECYLDSFMNGEAMRTAVCAEERILFA